MTVVPINLPESASGARKAALAGGRSWVAWAVLCGVAAAGAAFMGLPARMGASPEFGTLPQSRAEAPAWEALSAPPAYALETPAWSAARHAARLHARGGREDAFGLGSADEAGPFGRLEVVRGAADGEAPSLYVELVRRAGAAGLPVLRMGQSFALATKFGTAEAASVTLATNGSSACLAFRFAHGELAFRLAGFLCGTGEQAPSPDQLACLFDGLVLRAGTEDPDLKAIFAQAEKRRAPQCAAPVRMAGARRA